MAKYIKSHSNYVVKKKHQNVKDGYVMERDAFTVGGLDHFTEDKKPIYKSSNFLITVNNADYSDRDIRNDGWEGSTWTLETVSETQSNSANTMDINLKLDYHKLKDYAYYGSCSELIRSSINHIVSIFPGELHMPSVDGAGVTAYAIDPISKESIELSYDNYKFLWDNPFNIDVHTIYVNEDEVQNKLRYFANGGYENYELFSDNGESLGDVTAFNVERIGSGCTANSANYLVTINSDSGTAEVVAVSDGADSFVYLGKEENVGYSIRPKNKFYDEFFTSLDNFEKVLMNRHSEPLYKCKFEIITPNSFGKEIELKEFVFPRTYGGYNLCVNDVPYFSYLDSLADIGEYYDEEYSDNLYKSMTHESIKNFDFTRETITKDGEVAENLDTANRIQKMLRVVGREFDEIKTYIDGIKAYNTITYDDKNNIPDYFLTDEVEIEGWDTNNIYTKKMTEVDEGGVEVTEDIDRSNDFKEIRLTNIFTGGPITRTFEDDITTTSTPYSYKNKYKIWDEKTDNDVYNGYYVDTSFSSGTLDLSFVLDTPLNIAHDAVPNKYSSGTTMTEFSKEMEDIFGVSTTSAIPLDNNDKYFVTECGVKNKIKEYTNEKEYTPSEVNNHFMKMLKLNSRQILSKKGTIDGVEQMLSLFGMKSDRMCKTKEEVSNLRYDYNISEYSIVTNGLYDKFNEERGMYHIDWYNYTKMYNYDTEDYRNGVYVPYQGLPVTYKEKLNNSGEVEYRILYPYFDKDSQYDGYLYYQMKGGWRHTSPIEITPLNDIISANTSNNLSGANCKETLRNVRKVETIKDLLTEPKDRLENGDVYYVEDISKEYAIVNGEVYEVFTENYDGKDYKFFELHKDGDSILIGGIEFLDVIYVSNPYYPDYERTCVIENLQEDSVLKVYILHYDESGTPITTSFSYDDDSLNFNIKLYSDYASVSNFTWFRKQSQNIDTQKYNTNYFRLNDRDFSHEISLDGWSQITTYDVNYKKIEGTLDYFKGNNPHSARKRYDLGESYIDRMSLLFKDAIEDNAFDIRCYNTGAETMDYVKSLEEIETIGFNIDSGYTDDCNITYLNNKCAVPNDTKIHYLGKYFANNENGRLVSGSVKSLNDITTYNGKVLSKGSRSYVKNFGDYYDQPTPSQLKDMFSEHQIINTKVVELTFLLKGIHDRSQDALFKSKGIEEVKYLEDVVMPYVEQMIPSGTILKVKYRITNG